MCFSQSVWFSISVFLNLCDSQSVLFSISVFLNLCDFQSVLFSISVFLNLCNSQSVRFSISVFLNLCVSQLVFFSISAIWGRHHQLDDSLVGQLTIVWSLLSACLCPTAAQLFSVRRVPFQYCTMFWMHKWKLLPSFYPIPFLLICRLSMKVFLALAVCNCSVYMEEPTYRAAPPCCRHTQFLELLGIPTTICWILILSAPFYLISFWSAIFSRHELRIENYKTKYHQR